MTSKHIDYNATLIKKNILTPGLAIFRVQHDNDIQCFTAGQYAILGLNHREKGPVMRPYSIASPPHRHNDYLEFYVRYVDSPTSDNPLTHLLFDLEPGARLMMREKIAGHFTVGKTMGEDDPRLRVLVAAGTGLGPFLPMVLEHQHQTGNAGPYALLHAASHPEALGYRHILETVMNQGDHHRYLPTISRPQLAPDWKGLTGRAEAHFTPEGIENLEDQLGLGRGGFNPENCTVMICGLTGTIANSLMGLMHRGFVPADRKLRRALGISAETESAVYFEQYDAAPILDVKNQELMENLAQQLRHCGVSLDERLTA